MRGFCGFIRNQVDGGNVLGNEAEAEEGRGLPGPQIRLFQKVSAEHFYLSGAD